MEKKIKGKPANPHKFTWKLPCAVVTTTIRLRFDGRSTAIKGH